MPTFDCHTRKIKDVVSSESTVSEMKTIPLFSQGAFLMCSFAQEETESSKHWDSLWDIQPSGAVWVSVESRRVFMFAAGTEGHVWTLAHLSSKGEKKNKTRFGIIF